MNRFIKQYFPSPPPPPALSGIGVPHIMVSKKQLGNPVLKFIRLLPYKIEEGLVPDFVVGDSTCVLFLSMRYHLLHPQYVFARLATLKSMYKLRVLLVLVDCEDTEKSLLTLGKICLNNDLTMILSWSDQEAARYLETYKSYEKKSSEAIKEQSDASYISVLSGVLMQIRSVNKTDVMTLASTFGSLSAIMNANMEELSHCPGLGEKKVKRIYEAFHSRHFAGTTGGHDDEDDDD